MQADTTTEKPKRYQCRHIFTDGRRCGSASLRNEEFCYFHHGTRTPISDPSARKAKRETFDLPLPEDRSAIQISIGQVLQRIASNDLDHRRASLLLYGLQIASHNLPKEHFVKDEELIPLAHVEEVVLHPELGALAPEAEAPPRTRSQRERILDWRDRDITDREVKLNVREARLRNIEPRPPIPPPNLPTTPYNPTSSILPEVKAVADNLPKRTSSRRATPRKRTSSRPDTAKAHIVSTQDPHKRTSSRPEAVRFRRSGETPVFRLCAC